MRLEILNSGYKFRTKVLFALIRMVSRHQVPDAAKLVFYRSEFYGLPMKKFTYEAMRGQTVWSIGDLELMSAFISKVNSCPFCIGAHSATAAMAYNDEEKVSAVLSDLETAPIREPLKATLRMLGKLTREHTVSAEDLREVMAVGASREQIEGALAVCFAFNVTDRLANAFEFEILGQEGFNAGAKFLLKRGYK